MMKRFFYCVFLLLLMVFPLRGIPYEQTEEYKQKQAILNERAAKFKAETGFEGYLVYSHQTMRFSNYFGNFKDIQVTAPQDTVSMAQVLAQVLIKVKPYIVAREGQLVREKIESRVNGTWVTYRQRVNGYGIDVAGVLRIGYNIPTSEIIVTDNTVDIPDESVPINITEDEAINAVLQRYDTNVDFDINHWMFRRHVKLVYAPIEYASGIVEYKLCYLVSFGGGVNYVDPTTGEVIYIRKIRIANDECNTVCY